MKICFGIDNKTEVGLEGVEIEPEIVIRTSEGLLIEIFGSMDDLKKLANDIHKAVNLSP